MKNKFILTVALAVVIINGLVGHFFAPSGIIFTPIIILITTTLIMCLKNISIVWKSFLIYLCIGINDIVIKLYSGGKHDYEGLGWIHFTMLIGVIISFILLLVMIVKTPKEKIISKITALLLFPILISIHWFIFNNIGIGRCYWYNWN